MITCIFCGNEIGRVAVAYQYLIPVGDNEEPLRGSGNAHVKCIAEFERAQFDYPQMAQNAITQWEELLAE